MENESFISNCKNGSKNDNSVDLRNKSGRNEDILKSLAELKDNDETRNNRIDDLKSLKDSSTLLRMKAETVAEMYLGDTDASVFLRFLDFYVALSTSSNPETNFTDQNIVKSFHLFDGNIQKSNDFLLVKEELEELGFEEDKVVSALMLFTNDREAALDFLMKN